MVTWTRAVRVVRRISFYLRVHTRTWHTRCLEHQVAATPSGIEDPPLVPGGCTTDFLSAPISVAQQCVVAEVTRRGRNQARQYSSAQINLKREKPTASTGRRTAKINVRI